MVANFDWQPQIGAPITPKTKQEQIPPKGTFWKRYVKIWHVPHAYFLRAQRWWWFGRRESFYAMFWVCICSGVPASSSSTSQSSSKRGASSVGKCDGISLLHRVKNTHTRRIFHAFVTLFPRQKERRLWEMSKNASREVEVFTFFGWWRRCYLGSYLRIMIGFRRRSEAFIVFIFGWEVMGGKFLIAMGGKLWESRWYCGKNEGIVIESIERNRENRISVLWIFYYRRDFEATKYLNVFFQCR